MLNLSQTSFKSFVEVNNRRKLQMWFEIFKEIAPWTGRFYSLLDPSYAKNNIPIIASVSEHQPTAWSSFYFDLQFLVFTFPGWFSFLHIYERFCCSMEKF